MTERSDNLYAYQSDRPAQAFVVEGRFEFPLDMLRRDRCWPQTDADAEAIPAEGPDRRRVRRVTLETDQHSRQAPFVERWESFGWAVVAKGLEPGSRLAKGGKEEVVVDRKIPPATYRTRQTTMTLGDLTRSAPERRMDLESMGITAERWVCGFPLPPWQREPAWSEAQAMRFIESVWAGFDLGALVIVDFDRESRSPWQQMVIDGQHRLQALEAYTRDAFRVHGYYFSELTVQDLRAFRNATTINVALLDCHDEATLRRFSDLLNFGGTHHRADERAQNQ